MTELFPVSSLGHSVLVPAWLGWDSLVKGQSADESFYLAFLLAGEWFRRRVVVRAQGVVDDGGRRLDTLALREAGVVGVAQTAALFAGVSRSGITMVAGLARGLSHEDAARFSFLLATPIILAAGVYKLPDLLGSNGEGIRGQVLVGSVVAGVAAYVSVKFLVRWFTSRTLTPFGVYCLVVGVICIIRFA